jgi:hypothetical protein
MRDTDALKHLKRAAAELAEIRRGKEFAQWNEYEKHHLDSELADSEPFRSWRDTFIFTGDGAFVTANGRFGPWAIGRLVSRLSAEEVLAAFHAEITRNSVVYSEVMPLFGVQIDAPCQLADGVTVEPWPDDLFQAYARNLWSTELRSPPEGTSFLRQVYTVTPAFERRTDDTAAPTISALTTPPRATRDAMRERVRLACLLASVGPVECPLTVLRPDRAALFVAGDLNLSERPGLSRPIPPCPVEASALKIAFEALSGFRKASILERAINRLGRSRIAGNDVDRALELGMSAEIALMYGQDASNTEITYKIGSRAAWLLGEDPETRAGVFAGMKALYSARSEAVHAGVLKRGAAVDLEASDRLVARILTALAQHDDFPDWQTLVLGGHPTT